MTKLENETLVKKALNIDSFRNLSKDKMIEFFSLIPNMDKDVAISIINQFPDYVSVAKDLVNYLATICESALSSNTESQKNAIESYNVLLAELGELLKKDNLSIEEKHYIIEKAIIVADKISAKDSENKQFLLTIVRDIACTFGSVLIICAAVLGVNSKYTKVPQL